MATIKSPAYLSNPHCQVYDQFIDRMAMEWQNTRLADQPKRRRAHQDAIAAVIDKRDERLADDGLLVVEHWGQGEDNNYYVDLLPACAECRGRPAEPGQGGFCSDSCAISAAGDL